MTFWTIHIAIGLFLAIGVTVYSREEIDRFDQLALTLMIILIWPLILGMIAWEKYGPR